MISGLLVNEIGFLLGLSRPLSSLPLLIVSNIFMFVTAFLVVLKNDYDTLLKIQINWKFTPILILVLLIPITSILGAMWVTKLRNNLILLITIALIPFLISLGVFSKKLFPTKLYAITTFIVSLSLILHSSLIFTYPISYGSDTSYELFIFKSTESKAYWNSTLFQDMLHGRVNSMASVTILPTFYSTLLNLDPLYVRKIFYPVIFCLVPLILFQFWKKKYGDTKGFFAAFLLMSSNTFYMEMIGLGRQMIAELFLALLLLSIFGEKKTLFNKICFLIFSFALVISHYALAEIFLGLISLVMVLVVFLTKNSPRRITVTMILFLFVVMFAWYVYTSNSKVFESTLSFGNNLIGQLDEFFNLSAREPTVLRALGLEQSGTIWNSLSRLFGYLTELFIVLGFIALITKRIEIKFEIDFYILTVVSMVFLALVIVLPGMSKTLNVTRFYHTLLFFLAPLCILGTEFLTKLLFRSNRQSIASTLLLLVLVPYFLFQTGFVYELTGTQSWAPLSLHRMDNYRLYFWSGYVDDKSVYGVRWISKNVNYEYNRIYADLSSIRNLLRTYGLIGDRYVSYLSNTTILSQGELVYLNSLNSIYNIVVTEQYNCSTGELRFLKTMDRIYTNSGAEIYKNVP